MIDFHCHLDLYPDPKNVAQEIERRGLQVLSVTTTPSAWRGTASLGAISSNIMTSLGLHPQIAHERKGELTLFESLIESSPFVGEIGLDGAPEFAKHWADQEEVFARILRSCEAVGGRIMSIHSRRATASVLDMIQAIPGAGHPVLHWYSGNLTELRRAIRLGCWFSINHAMLSSNRGRRAIAAIPRNRLLTETDGPFTRVGDDVSMPWDVERSLGSIAEIWGVAIEEVSYQLESNLKELLSKC